MSNMMGKKLSDMLTNKPLWIWWIIYLIIMAALFGLFRLVFYLLGIIPLVGVLVLIATALIWGYIAYSNNKSRKEGPLRNTNEENSSE